MDRKGFYDHLNFLILKWIFKQSAPGAVLALGTSVSSVVSAYLCPVSHSAMGYLLANAQNICPLGTYLRKVLFMVRPYPEA